jgi:hypothetical protein
MGGQNVMENNIKTSIIREIRKLSQYSKETENYTVIYRGDNV